MTKSERHNARGYLELAPIRVLQLYVARGRKGGGAEQASKEPTYRERTMARYAREELKRRTPKEQP